MAPVVSQHPIHGQINTSAKRAPIPRRNTELAIITANAGSNIDIQQISDNDPYKGTLCEGIRVEDSEYEGKKSRRLTIDWQLGESDDAGTLRDWITIAFGRSKSSGQVSKFRQLLNALVDKPKEEAIAWFNDETFEWGYDNDTSKPYAKLTPGMEVIFRGERGVREDGTPKFSIQKYQSVASLSKGKRSLRPAAADDDSIPF